jgi:hypothetical protein
MISMRPELEQRQTLSDILVSTPMAVVSVRSELAIEKRGAIKSRLHRSLHFTDL